MLIVYLVHLTASHRKSQKSLSCYIKMPKIAIRNHPPPKTSNVHMLDHHLMAKK